ncbi:hypothetical protein [Elizabethkingia miricola]|uniref:hypothetical protein n=1 Tax=Elizabethkingia miricola TaxID=172045 RepID=UPI001185027E|nr:hypothetical protein [Elizabethkingia miricola]
MRQEEYYGEDFQLFAEVRFDEMFPNGAFGYYQMVYNYNMLSNDGYARNTYERIYKVVAKAKLN